MPTVKSADRVLTLFELLGGLGGEMSHTELAEALDIPKSSLSQLLRNLVQREWLDYSHETKKYSLGKVIVRLARRAADKADLAAIARPVLEELTTRIGESSCFNVIKGHRLEVRAAALGSQRLTSLMREGDQAPLYATSGGKALLAFAPKHVLDDYLAVLHRQEAGNAKIPTPRALVAQLDEVRRNEIAYARDEWTLGITGVARPVLAPDLELLGSINFAIPSSRYTDALGARAADALLRAVSMVSDQLKHRTAGR